ncbi:hypothetical protein ACQ86N_29945 [Puia sp. P3]|uniref:hypothetical protein n=1 Tax=Puia sp. P3 TaxID=3423952 RepID=UPI003D67EACF
MKKIVVILGLFGFGIARGQETMGLDSVFAVIGRSHPALRSSDALARSLDESAKGARTWEAPQVSMGWWMTPYDPSLWKRQRDGASGIGQYMVSAEQMLPNRRRQDAEGVYAGHVGGGAGEERGDGQ